MTILDVSQIEVGNKNMIGTNNKNLLYKTLKNNVKIDDTLHIIVVISNVCEFKRRYELATQFIERMHNIENIKLYVVELVYDDQNFHITDSLNPQHLQLRTTHALWHKENLINVGVKKLLPSNWKAMAWIDADIEFENNDWVENTLKALTEFDIIQLFHLCLDLDEHENPMHIWQSFCYKYCNGKTFNYQKGTNYWHCGYAWACTKTFYDKMNGLYDKGILGSGDYILSQTFFKNTANVYKHLNNFRKDIREHYFNVLNYDVKIGYIPSTIKHYFHGSKKNRKYLERNEILIKYNYDPVIHMQYDENGILIPTEKMSEEFLNEIKKYFFQRNDDEYYELIAK